MIGKLLGLCREESLINVFERNTYSVVNIFDISLRVGGRPAPVLCEVPVYLSI